jgi:DNA-binding CsgD family transcriptional regulator
LTTAGPAFTDPAG